MKRAAFAAGLIAFLCAGATLADPQPGETTGGRTYPPIILRFTIETDNDDLRGGGDNVLASIDVGGQPTRPFLLNQRGMRWADGSRHSVDMRMPAGTRFDLFRTITLQTTFRGGIDGDNWTMRSLVVTMRHADDPPGAGVVIARHGRWRFTGDRRALGVPVQLPFAGRPDLLTK